MARSLANAAPCSGLAEEAAATGALGHDAGVLAAAAERRNWTRLPDRLGLGCDSWQ